MQVLFVANFPPPVHGVSEFNRVLCERFDRDGVSYRRYPIGSRGALAEVGRASPVKTMRDVGALVAVAADIARMSHDERRRAVIYFTASQSGGVVMRDRLLAEIGRRFDVPLVAHIHGCAWLDTWRRGGVLARSMLSTLRACSQVICLGPTYASRLAEAIGVPTVGINNGVPAPGALGPAVVPGERLELLFLSNLMRAKGLWVAAAAADILHARGTAVRLRCAGAWKSAEEQEAFARDFAPCIARGTIELVGFADQERKRSLFASSHMFLLPTLNPLEGQPLAAIEAMAAGVVPLTTLTASITDLLSGFGGELLAQASHETPDGLAATIASLASTPARCAELAHACRARYEAALTDERCTRDVIAVLATVSQRR